VDARASADPTEAVLASLEGLDQAGAVVRIMVTLHDHQQAAFREREVLAALAEAASVNVVREVESESRARLGDLGPEALGPIELLQRYFESRKVDDARLPVLLEKAEELLRDPD
jgi:hypothetical protein